MDPVKIQELEGRLGHTFEHKEILIRALTHPTFSNVESMKKGEAKRDCPHQETYSTLGDAILKAGFVSILMEKGLKTKGKITISKADLENNLHLAKVGKQLRLLEDNFIRHNIGKEEKLKEGSVALCSDTVEALIGAIFIDSGDSMTETKKCIEWIFKMELNELKTKLLNSQ